MNVSTKLTLLMTTLLAGDVTMAALDLRQIHAMAESARVVHLVDTVRAAARRIEGSEATGLDQGESIREIDRILGGLLAGDRGRETPRIRGEQMRRELVAAWNSWLTLKEALDTGGIRGDREVFLRSSEMFVTQIRRAAETAMAVSRNREDRHRLMVGALAVLSILLVLGAWWVIQKDVARPIAHLADKARRVSLGDARVRFELGDGDELDVLAHCLDAMVSGLKDRIRELADAKAGAEAASQAKSEFLSRMGHELRTPLHTILGYTDLVLDGVEGPINPEQRSSLSRVSDQGHHLLKLIDRILAYARLIPGGISARSEPFEVRSVLRRLSHLATLAERKGIRFSLRVSPGAPEWLLGDAAALFEVLESLVENAVKFTGKGETVVQVDLDSEGEETVRLHFTVRDTGVGIPAELQTAIFDAFHQAGPSSTRAHAGVGLGLTTAALWAQPMGGRLWAESEPGHGSTFHFVVPFGKCETDRGHGNRGDHGNHIEHSAMAIAPATDATDDEHN